MTSIELIRSAVENNSEEIEKILCEDAGVKFFFVPDEEYLLRKYVEYLFKDLDVETAKILDEETKRYLYKCSCEYEDFGDNFADAIREICKEFCY